MSTSLKKGTRDNLLKVVLMIAACFAIGSVGFFVAVLLQSSTQNSTEAVIQPIQVKQDAAMQSLAASEQSANASSTSAASVTGVSASQAASNDASAATKLKVLENLNSQ